jgi:hypothetical protein
MNAHAVSIIECICRLRYMRRVSRNDESSSGQVACACGRVLASWRGPVRIELDPEEPGLPPARTEVSSTPSLE